jgi:hypothetical protein
MSYLVYWSRSNALTFCGCSSFGYVLSDAVSEVEVQLSNYTAEYGRSGGSQINIITEGGGKGLHGTAYWYKRHEMFNANAFFRNATGVPRQLYRFQNLGGTIGGPIKKSIPIINRGGDKMFFFYSYDNNQIKEPVNLERWTMPTVLERAGNFSQSNDLNGRQITVRDPNNGNLPFPDNIIPSTRANPFGVAIMNIFPTPNTNAAGYNYIFQEESLGRPATNTCSASTSAPPTTTPSPSKAPPGTPTPSAITSPAAPPPGASSASATNSPATSSPSTTPKSSAPASSTKCSPLLHRYRRRPHPTTKKPAASSASIAASPDSASSSPSSTPSTSSPKPPSAASPPPSRLPPSPMTTASPLRRRLQSHPHRNLTYIRGTHTYKAGAYRENSRFGQARSSLFAGQFDFGQDVNDPLTDLATPSRTPSSDTSPATPKASAAPPSSPARTPGPSSPRTPGRSAKTSPSISASASTGAPGPSSPTPKPPPSPLNATTPRKPPPSTAPSPPPTAAAPINPLNGQILPQTYIGAIVPGTGDVCNTAITPDTPVS